MATFSYPYDTPTSTVTLPEPLWGNSDILGLKVTKHISMNGVNYSYKKGEPSRKLLLTFNNLNTTERTALYAFLELTTGLVVKYIDHKDITWHCYIINPVHSIKQLRQYLHSITLELEVW